MRKKVLMISIKRALKRLGRLPTKQDPVPSEQKPPRSNDEPQHVLQGLPASEEEKPTDEQRQIMLHPDGYHARVLAVAGSGKTSAMAYRIEYLMRKKGVSKNQIQVLMFNRLAREQFREKLEEHDFGRSQQPQVDTFHSFAYRIANMVGHVQWIGEQEWMKTLRLRIVLSAVERKNHLREYELSLVEAERAISLWKGALTPPSSAGYSGSCDELYTTVYKEFEKLRHEENAITYDDFVPLAVALLKGDRNKLEKHAGSLKYIIVDEYQDINLGQQCLIELLASCGADVMVVGDDDQTIYEWRGARSEFIIREFMSPFDDKPHHSYNLSRTFRFGYGIAQAAFNLIGHNTNRAQKNLLTYFPRKDCEIAVFTPTESESNYNRLLSLQLSSILKQENIEASDLRVLGRTYAQLNSFSTELLLKRIPFIIEGSVPYFKSREALALLDYLRVAAVLEEVPSSATDDRFLNIANKPSRYLGRADLKRMLQEGRKRKLPLGELLFETAQDPTRFNRGSQREKFEDLVSLLEEVGRQINQAPDKSAGILLEWIEKEIGLLDYYRRYHGEGEECLLHTQNITALISYAQYTELEWRKFIDHVENFDTTLGRPEADCVRMTTIHRTKGLEFDYVFVPDCKEGFMPVFALSEDLTYDTRDPGRKPRPAEWIENERRLFYVGITRARKGLYLSAPALTRESRKSRGKATSSNSRPSRFLEEWELGPTLSIANELVPAAKHEEGHSLVQKCNRFSAYHKIVGVVKEHYSGYFTGKTRQRLAEVQLADAVRPFRYEGSYSNNIKRDEGARNGESDKGTLD